MATTNTPNTIPKATSEAGAEKGGRDIRDRGYGIAAQHSAPVATGVGPSRAPRDTPARQAADVAPCTATVQSPPVPCRATGPTGRGAPGGAGVPGVPGVPEGAPRMLALLRGDHRRRPVVDPGLAGGLREWLEDGVSEPCSRLTGASALVISGRALTGALAGAGTPVTVDPGAPRTVNLPIARGVLVGNLFRQLVATGRIEDPMGDAMGALMVDPARADVVAFVGKLAAGERGALRAEVARHALALREQWTMLPARWLPRTQDRITIPLAGGRIVLAGSVDLLIGAPSEGRASVCLVEITSGTPRAEHRDELHFAALLETLRSGAPPFRVVSHYTPSGETRAEDLTEEHLTLAVRRTIAGLAALCASRDREQVR